MFKIFESGCHFTGADPKGHLWIPMYFSITAAIPLLRAHYSHLWLTPRTSHWYPMDSGHSTQGEPVRGEKANHPAVQIMLQEQVLVPWTWKPWSLEVITSALLFGDYFQTAGLTPHFEKLGLPALILTSGVWPPVALTAGVFALNLVPYLVTCPVVFWSLG